MGSVTERRATILITGGGAQINEEYAEVFEVIRLKLV